MFDVSTAFLSGNPTDRQVYVKAPSDGLPETEQSAWLQYALLHVLKSVYGLAKAPRLWYARPLQLLGECGMKELDYARATFVLPSKEMRAVCTLHVDGMLPGDPNPEKIDARFNIEWKDVNEPISRWIFSADLGLLRRQPR